MDSRGKKTAVAVHNEVALEINKWLHVLFNGRRKTGHLDLGAIEMLMRSAMHNAGAAGITELLQLPVPDAGQRTVPCSCGQTANYLGLRSKPILTAVGRVQVSRPYYLCSSCHNGQFPADVELDIENTEYSPGVRRMLAVVGQDGPFERGRQQMELLAGLKVTTKAVERIAESIGSDIAAREQQQIGRAMQLDLPIVLGEPVHIMYVLMDGTGLPVVKKETAGRAGKKSGEPAHTREAKLGCVFTQTTWDKDGYPIRDPDSTTYTGAIETAEEFGKRLYLEAWNRGWNRAEKKVVIGDGAEWIWNIANQHFPGAVQIVDLFHARQHVSELAQKLFPSNMAERARWITMEQDKLDNGKIEELVISLRSLQVDDSVLAAEILTQAEYFNKNAERMQYPKFRAQHLFVGSGVIEAGCRTVMGARLKQSGMFWTVRGANSIIALKRCHMNGEFEDYWESRAA